jgi:hypothetical protein
MTTLILAVETDGARRLEFLPTKQMLPVLA